MAFTANNVLSSNKDDKKILVEQTTTNINNQLNSKELEILLSLIKHSTFVGEQIEPLYNMVIKLQNQYLDQIK